MDKIKELLERFKKPVVLTGCLTAFLSATGMSAEMFSNWEILMQVIYGVLSNPYQLITLTWTVAAILNDSSTNGIS